MIAGSSTGTTDYSATDMNSNINRHYDRVVSLILRADNRWEWDDENYTTLPVATTDLVSGQADYNIASSDFLVLTRLEVKDSSGNWIYLEPISYEDKKGVAMTEWAKTNSIPQAYDKVGNSVILYPTPNYSSTAGLRAYYQRIPSYFATDATTKTPGFSTIYHRLLSYSAAYDYALLNLPNRAAALEREMLKMEESLLTYYGSRSRDEQPRISFKKENYGGDEYEGEQAVDWSS